MSPASRRRSARPSWRSCGAACCVISAIASCGRVGYDTLPEGRTRGSGGGGARDASTQGGLDASSGATSAESGGPGESGGAAAGGVAAGGRGAGGAGTGGGNSGIAGGNAGADAGEPTRDAGRDALPDAPVVPPCSVAAVADYCTTLPSLPVAPVIDGTADCNVALQPMPELGWTGGSTVQDAHAEFALAWRPDGLYVFVHVRDPSLVPADTTRSVWQGDALEIYVDADGAYTAPPAYDNPGTRQLVVGAPTTAAGSAARGAQYAAGHAEVEGVWSSTAFRAYGRSDGYVIEAFIAAADLGLSTWKLAAGGKVGIDLSIDVSYSADQGADAGGFGNRVGQYFMRLGQVNGTSVLPPFDVRAFCNPSLVP